jgi:hypothetical protein
MIIPNTLVSNVVIINSYLQSTRVCNFITLQVDYETDIGMASPVRKIVFEEKEDGASTGNTHSLTEKVERISRYGRRD